MKQIHKHIIVLLLAGWPVFASSQETAKTTHFENIIESLVEDLEGETDYLSILEYLEEYFENPLNLNIATEEELKHLSFLNEIQISNLLNYRNRYGDIYSIFELTQVEGFSREVLEKIQPFVKFETSAGKTIPQKLPLKYGRHHLFLRSTRILQEAKGYKNKNTEPANYEGNPFRLYSRYRFQLGNQLSVGLTAEKDPGEAFFTGSNSQGFDYYSGHISMGFNSILKNVTIGDFVVRSGQGLVLWQGYAPGKSADVLAISKNISGIRPYTSNDENLFFRGVSTTFQLQNLGLQLFYSHKNKDANLGFSGASQTPGYFTSLQTSGYHRTANEIDDEKSVREIATGALIEFQKNRLKVGATIFYQQFELPLILNDGLHNSFKFSGDENINAGLNYRYLAGKYELFGEAAWSQSNGMAVLQGLTAHLHDQATLSMLFRHFDKDYHAIYSNTFSEGSSTINETGFYMGLKVLPAPNFRLQAYADFYKSPWLNFTTAAPSTGNDILFQLEYRPSKNILVYARYKNEEKEGKTVSKEKYVNAPQQKKQTRLYFQYDVSEKVTLRSRFEYVLFKDESDSHGFMFYQDLVYKPIPIPLTGYARFALFNTQSYDSRVYAYENDLLYTYSIPAYHGKGFRAYLNFSYTISKNLSLWCKLSNTHWTDRESISSGNNEIDGKNLTEVKFQARLKF